MSIIWAEFIHIFYFLIQLYTRCKELCRLIEATFSDVSEANTEVSSIKIAVNAYADKLVV